MSTSFRAVVVQSNVTMVDNTAPRDEIRQTMAANLERVLELIDWAAAYRLGGGRKGGPPMLIGLPESFLHSFPRADGARVENMLKVAVEVPGEETERLGEKARAYNAYIFGATYELDREWPGRYFNCGFIVDPQGQVALKYRKIYCGAIETATSPHDILDAYVERYGYEALFPVLDTPIGKLAVMICADSLFGSETARAMAMRGAEILCYPISTTSPEHTYYHVTAQARAIDNACYIVSPNLGMTLSRQRAANTGGESVIVDYEGRILAKAATTGETTMACTLHLDALRDHRLHTQHGVARLRAECFGRLYDQPFFPANACLSRPKVSLADEATASAEAVAGLLARGVLTRPSGS